MVIVSGSTISRESFSLASLRPCPLRRWVRRRKAATERVRSSSPAVALVTVKRPRLRCSPPRVGRGGSTTFAGWAMAPGRRITRLDSSSSAIGARAVGGAAGVAVGEAAAIVVGFRAIVTAGVAEGSPPARRRRASSSVLRLKSASCARRSSSSRLRASAASRSTRSRASRSARSLASASCRRRSSSSRARAPTSALARASRCSSVNVCRTTPVFGGGVGVKAALAVAA